MHYHRSNGCNNPMCGRYLGSRTSQRNVPKFQIFMATARFWINFPRAARMVDAYLISLKDKLQTMSDFFLRIVVYVKNIRILSAKLSSSPSGFPHLLDETLKLVRSVFFCLGRYVLHCLLFLYPGKEDVASWALPF